MPINTRVHGMLDYVVGLILIAAPFLLGFADGSAAMWAPIAVGGAALVYSLMTNYELGAVRVIPMPMHLLLDAMSGVFLAASPWLFGFADKIWWPHVVFGLLEIGAAAMTQHRPTLTSRTGIDMGTASRA